MSACAGIVPGGTHGSCGDGVVDRRLAALCMITLSVVSGCTGGVAPSGATTGLPSISPPVVTPGMGLVDASSASFTVPIDVYGMSVGDINIVEAAHAVQFDMCSPSAALLSSTLDTHALSRNEPVDVGT